MEGLNTCKLINPIFKVLNLHSLLVSASLLATKCAYRTGCNRDRSRRTSTDEAEVIGKRLDLVRSYIDVFIRSAAFFDHSEMMYLLCSDIAHDLPPFLRYFLLPSILSSLY